MAIFRFKIKHYQTNFLFQTGYLDEIQALLKKVLPEWSTKLHIRAERREKPSIIPIDQPGALEKALRAVFEKNRIRYRKFLEKMGKEDDGKFIETVELRGAHHYLIVLIGFSKDPYLNNGRHWGFGNDITFQIQRKTMEGELTKLWSQRVLHSLIETFDPIHCFARMQKEFDAKNMCLDDGAEAIGRDISRYLPGIYWLNYFGPEYAKFIGEDVLMNAPAHETKKIGKGVLLCLDEDPQAWDTPAYRQREAAVLDAIGREYFFDRHCPDRPSKAPDFGLPILKGPPPLSEAEEASFREKVKSIFWKK